MEKKKDLIHEKKYYEQQLEKMRKRIKFAVLPIYVVTTIKIGEQWLNQDSMKFLVPYDSRTVGFFFKEEDAISCVTENWGDVYEDGHYLLAVIEETWQGLYPHIEKETWFKWNIKKKKYVKIDKPSVFKNIVSFGIG